METVRDTHSVSGAFNRHAPEYDRHASVQKRVIGRLVQLVQSHLSAAPASVLDIGCGTGLLLDSLRRLYPESRLSGLDLAYSMLCRSRERLGPGVTLVQADAGLLPFRRGSTDLLVSTSTLQWLADLDGFFQECHRVMSSDSLLCIAFFGGNTLRELRECCRYMVERFGERGNVLLNRLHTFREMAEVKQSLERAGFDGALLTSEIEIEYHADMFELLRSIKNIGAGAHRHGGGGLGWRRILDETSRMYQERFQSGGAIPATYEVFYLVARKRSSQVTEWQ